MTTLISSSELFEKPDPIGIPVLMYHQIVSDGSRKPGQTAVPLEVFKEQMRFLKENGYTTLGFEEFVDILHGREPVSPKSVVLTFDDGRKNLLQAIPVLEQYGFKASFWIVTSKPAISSARMNWKDIQALDHNPLFTIGSHSVSHPKMVSLSESDVRFELRESKRVLEEHVGHPVKYFSWPFGNYNERTIQLAREEGYEVLLTANNGLNIPGEDVMRIHRTVVSGSNPLEVFSAQLKDGLHHLPLEKNSWELHFQKFFSRCVRYFFQCYHTT